jgi:hypothetical protein
MIGIIAAATIGYFVKKRRDKAKKTADLNNIKPTASTKTK